MYRDETLPEHFQSEETSWICPSSGQAYEGEGPPPPSISPPGEARLFQDISFSHEVQLHLQLSFNAHQALEVRVADGAMAGPGEVPHRFNDIMRKR